MRHRFRTPSPSLVISLLALFVALGGTSYAAINLPRNSVSTKQLKKNAVTTKKIKNGAVTAPKIKNNAVRANKIKNGAVPAAKINTAGLTVPNSTHATSADDASALNGLGANEFVQGGGLAVAGRATLVLGGGGLQHIVTVPGFGEVVGGCGSGGAAVGFVNHFGHDLRVYPFAGSDITPVTFSDGTSSGLFPSGVGSAGMTMMQIGSTDFTDQRILTVIATRDAYVSGHCSVQAWAVTR